VTRFEVGQRRISPLISRAEGDRYVHRETGRTAGEKFGERRPSGDSFGEAKFGAQARVSPPPYAGRGISTDSNEGYLVVSLIAPMRSFAVGLTRTLARLQNESLHARLRPLSVMTAPW
jgi:hypothetical protein